MLTPYRQGAIFDPSRGGLLAPFIDGWTTELAADADRDVQLNPGAGTDSLVDSGRRVQTTAALIKQIDGAWAEGTNAGGMSTGTVAVDTEYNLIIIEQDDGGAVDMIFDVSPTGANAPAGWTARRRVLSVFTDGSANIRPYIQAGDRVFFDEFVRDVNDSTGVLGTYETATVSVPAGMVGQFSVLGQVTTATDIQVAIRPGGGGNPTNTGKVSFSAVSSSTATLQFPVLMAVDASSQIEYTLRSGDGTWANIQVVIMGWIDDRGRNA